MDAVQKNGELVISVLSSMYQVLEKKFSDTSIFCKNRLEAYLIIHILMTEDAKQLLAKHSPKTNDKWISERIRNLDISQLDSDSLSPKDILEALVKMHTVTYWIKLGEFNVSTFEECNIVYPR